MPLFVRSFVFGITILFVLTACGGSGSGGGDDGTDCARGKLDFGLKGHNEPDPVEPDPVEPDPVETCDVSNNASCVFGSSKIGDCKI